MYTDGATEFPYGVALFLIALGSMFSIMGFVSWWDIRSGNFIVTYPKSDRRFGFCMGIFSALFVVAWVIEMILAPTGKGPTSLLPALVFSIGCIVTLIVAFVTRED